MCAAILRSHVVKWISAFGDTARLNRATSYHSIFSFFNMKKRCRWCTHKCWLDLVFMIRYWCNGPTTFTAAVTRQTTTNSIDQSNGRVPSSSSWKKEWKKGPYFYYIEEKNDFFFLSRCVGVFWGSSSLLTDNNNRSLSLFYVLLVVVVRWPSLAILVERNRSTWLDSTRL